MSEERTTRNIDGVTVGIFRVEEIQAGDLIYVGRRQYTVTEVSDPDRANCPACERNIFKVWTAERRSHYTYARGSRIPRVLDLNTEPAV